MFALEMKLSGGGTIEDLRELPPPADFRCERSRPENFMRARMG